RPRRALRGATCLGRPRAALDASGGASGAPWPGSYSGSSPGSAPPVGGGMGGITVVLPSVSLPEPELVPVPVPVLLSAGGGMGGMIVVLPPVVGRSPVVGGIIGATVSVASALVVGLGMGPSSATIGGTLS